MNEPTAEEPVRSNGTGSIFDRMGAETAKRTFEDAKKRGTVTWSVLLTLAYRNALAEKDTAKLRAKLARLLQVVASWIDAIDAEKAKNG